MRYVFVEIFGLFWLTPKTLEWPKNDPKNILCNFRQIIDKFPGFECWKQSKEKEIVIQEAFSKK